MSCAATFEARSPFNASASALPSLGTYPTNKLEHLQADISVCACCATSGGGASVASAAAMNETEPSSSNGPSGGDPAGAAGTSGASWGPPGGASGGLGATASSAPSGCALGGCLNRLSFIHCDARSCPCGDACSNRAFHALPGPRMEAFATENRGYGVRCMDRVPAGGFVIEYAGELLVSSSCASVAGAYAVA